MSWPDEAQPSDERPLFETYSKPGSGLLRYDFRGLGTDNVFLLAADDSPEVRDLVQGGFDLLDRLEQKLSKFVAESDVGLINQLAAHAPVLVGRETLELLAFSRLAWEITGGAFDPTVGPLLEAWGLVDLSGNVPSQAEIEKALSRCGMNRLEVDTESGTVRFGVPGMVLDLGGIAKGYVVDSLVDHFCSAGVEAGAVISGRSTVASWGRPPGQQAWQIEVADPRDPRGQGIGRFSSEPGVVSSSGAAERFFRRGDELYGHVIDPRDGRPVRHLLGSTVWTTRAMLGDVVSTALFVLGSGAAEPGACLQRLVNEHGEGRASFGWTTEASDAWGGQRLDWRHMGEPALRARSP